MLEEKALLRQKMKSLIRQYPLEMKRKMSQLAIEKLMASNVIKNAKVILMYYSLDDEVYTHDAVRLLYKAGKNILLPASLPDGTMRLTAYRGDSSLIKGLYGILQTPNVLDDSNLKIDVAVVPGVCFDKTNNRLGRGKGYYDRFLASHNNIYKIGLCFHFQLVEHLCTTCNDVKMDEIICS